MRSTATADDRGRNEIGLLRRFVGRDGVWRELVCKAWHNANQPELRQGEHEPRKRQRPNSPPCQLGKLIAPPYTPLMTTLPLVHLLGLGVPSSSAETLMNWFPSFGGAPTAAADGAAEAEPEGAGEPCAGRGEPVWRAAPTCRGSQYDEVRRRRKKTNRWRGQVQHRRGFCSVAMVNTDLDGTRECRRTLSRPSSTPFPVPALPPFSSARSSSSSVSVLRPAPPLQVSSSALLVALKGRYREGEEGGRWELGRSGGSGREGGREGERVGR